MWEEHKPTPVASALLIAKDNLDKLPLEASKDGAWLELIILWGP